jgi:hypothetical protein
MHSNHLSYFIDVLPYCFLFCFTLFNSIMTMNFRRLLYSYRVFYVDLLCLYMYVTLQ